MSLKLKPLRRAGVKKEQGLEIESTEAVRLFREATEYMLRLRELRENIEVEMRNEQYPNTERVIGHLDDYNRIIQDICRNPSFKSCAKCSIENGRQRQDYSVTV
jgi:hypothetical protein